MPTEADQLIVRKEIYTGRVQDELVFFDAEAGLYFATGTVGAKIWDLIETPQSMNMICAALVLRYEVDQDTCRIEVQKFIDQLVDAGLAELL